MYRFHCERIVGDRGHSDAHNGRLECVPNVRLRARRPEGLDRPGTKSVPVNTPGFFNRAE